MPEPPGPHPTPPPADAAVEAMQSAHGPEAAADPYRGLYVSRWDRLRDLLTTSPTRGHAQKVLDPAAAMGAIVGKALAPLAKGRGRIPVMVLLQ